MAAAAVLALATGVRGAAAGGIAAVTASVIFAGYLWFRGNTINGDVLVPIGMPLLTYPVGVWLAVASAGLIVARRTQVPPLWTQALLAGALATTLVAVGSAFGPFLAPEPRSLLTDTENQDVVVEDPVRVEADNYRYLLAPGPNDQFGTLLAALDLDAEAAPDPAVADWLTTQVGPRMTGLESQSTRLSAPTMPSHPSTPTRDGGRRAVRLSGVEPRIPPRRRSGQEPTSARPTRGGDEHHQAWLRGVGTI